MRIAPSDLLGPRAEWEVLRLPRRGQISSRLVLVPKTPKRRQETLRVKHTRQVSACSRHADPCDERPRRRAPAKASRPTPSSVRCFTLGFDRIAESVHRSGVGCVRVDADTARVHELCFREVRKAMPHCASVRPGDPLSIPPDADSARVSGARTTGWGSSYNAAREGFVFSEGASFGAPAERGSVDEKGRGGARMEVPHHHGHGQVRQMRFARVVRAHGETLRGAHDFSAEGDYDSNRLVSRRARCLYVRGSGSRRPGGETRRRAGPFEGLNKWGRRDDVLVREGGLHASEQRAKRVLKIDLTRRVDDDHARAARGAPRGGRGSERSALEKRGDASR